MTEEHMWTQELIRGGVTVASVYIGARMAMNSYRSNQWWDSRRTTYEKAAQILARIERVSLGAWLYQEAVLEGRLSAAPEEVIRNRGHSDEFERALEELYTLSDNGRFNMSYNVRSILKRIYWSMGKYRLRNFRGKSPIESPLNILGDGAERFFHASLADLRMLSWHERIESMIFRFRMWFQPWAFTLVYWLLSVLLVVWFGSEKGCRLSNKIRESFPFSDLLAAKTSNVIGTKIEEDDIHTN